MSRVGLYLPFILAWSLVVVGLLTSTLGWIVLGVMAMPLVLWVYHTVVFTSKDKKAIGSMTKLLPYYLVMSHKMVGVMIYPMMYIVRGWTYRTLGDKVKVMFITHGDSDKNLKLIGKGSAEDVLDEYRHLEFTWKEQVARVLHWFYEDEEELAKAHQGTYDHEDWVVKMVLPNKKIGSEFTAFETFMVNWYWEGNRNIMANFTTELLTPLGKVKGFRVVKSDRSDEDAHSQGIGNRKKGYSHTIEVVDGVEYPQFTYISDRQFITAGFGSSKGVQLNTLVHRFEVNNRLLNG